MRAFYLSYIHLPRPDRRFYLKNVNVHECRSRVLRAVNSHHNAPVTFYQPLRLVPILDLEQSEGI